MIISTTMQMAIKPEVCGLCFGVLIVCSSLLSNAQPSDGSRVRCERIFESRVAVKSDVIVFNVVNSNPSQFYEHLNKKIIVRNEIDQSDRSHKAETLRAMGFVGDVPLEILQTTDLSLRYGGDFQVAMHELMHFSLRVPHEYYFVGLRINGVWKFSKPEKGADSSISLERIIEQFYLLHDGHNLDVEAQAEASMFVHNHFSNEPYNRPDAQATKYLKSYLGFRESIGIAVTSNHPTMEDSLAFVHYLKASD